MKIFVAGCGKIERVRLHLEKKPVCLWTPLEDLALCEAEGSQEYRVLLMEKGLAEIKIRREFLGMAPVYEKDIEPILQEAEAVPTATATQEEAPIPGDDEE